MKSKSQTHRGGYLFLFVVSFLLLGLITFGCGGGKSPAPSSAPPFNTGMGEGNVVGNPLVTTYSTGTSGTQTGLDTFYSQTICPTGLSAQDCATNKANLNTTEFGNFDVSADPIANNALGIKQVAAVKIDYTAINVDQTPVTVSGGIAIPQVGATSLKGLILYFHGTTTQRTNVPSNFTPLTNTATATDGVLMAALWASQGYVVVMPDYIGLGDDTTEPHPYVVYPSQNAQVGLAMVRAARTLLAKSYQINGLLPLYITGYSEGGAYALEAGHLMQNNPGYASQLNVQLKKVVPLSGFFDLSGTGLSYLFYNITSTDNPWYSLDWSVSELSKPYLTAYLVASFANYANIPATNILAGGFYASGDCTALPASGANLNAVYFTNTQFSGYDAQVLAVADCQAIGVGWGATPPDYSNSITQLLTPAYAQALMQKDTSNPLYQQVVNADTYQFVPKFPVTLVSLEQDSVVTRVNSDVASTYFQQQNPGGPYLEELVPNKDFFAVGTLGTGEVDHLSELPFLSVLMLNQFNTTTQ